MGWHLVTGPEAGAWVAAQIDGSYQPGSTAIGLWRASDAFDGLVAGVLYEQWNGVSIVAHIAISGRMTPAFLAAIFDYPFHVCGVRKVISPIASDNLRSIKLAINMGFEHEATLKDAAPTGDILLFTLTKTKCRFLEDRYGKKCPRAPAGP
jgi:RimJ/RimL family protein N-acetyltransferase